MKPTIYLDTSVPSAYFDEKDPKRQELTKEFWKKSEKFDLFISTLVVKEINQMRKKNLFLIS